MREGCWTRSRRDRSDVILYVVHILSRQSLTRKERLGLKSGLLGMVNIILG